jgi:hypothetical protein
MLMRIWRKRLNSTCLIARRRVQPPPPAPFPAAQGDSGDALRRLPKHLPAASRDADSHDRSATTATTIGRVTCAQRRRSAPSRARSEAHAVLIRVGVGAPARESTPMLKVIHDDPQPNDRGSTDTVAGRSLLRQHRPVAATTFVTGPSPSSGCWKGRTKAVRRSRLRPGGRRSRLCTGRLQALPS